MQSELERIVDQKNSSKEVLALENGLMIYKKKEVLEWLSVQYKKRYEVYLLLDDYGEYPNRKQLTLGVGRTLDQARNAAVKNMEKSVLQKG